MHHLFLNKCYYVFNSKTLINFTIELKNLTAPREFRIASNKILPKGRVKKVDLITRCYRREIRKWRYNNLPRSRIPPGRWRKAKPDCTEFSSFWRSQYRPLLVFDAQESPPSRLGHSAVWRLRGQGATRNGGDTAPGVEVAQRMAALQRGSMFAFLGQPAWYSIFQ